MASRGRSLLLIMVSSLLALGAISCSTGAPPVPTKAPATSPTTPASSSAAPAAAAPTAAAAPATSGNEIRVGALFNITGQSAPQGALFSDSAKLAVKQINAAGGVNGKKITLVTEDAQSTNPGALSALNKSVEQDHPLVILGTNLSTQIQAMNDADKAAGVPFATGGTAVKNTQMGNPWILRLRPDDSIAAAAMVQYIKDDMKLTKVGIINDTDAFGRGGGDLVEQYSKAQGLTVAKRVEYTAGTKDFTAQLLAIKDAGAQVVVGYTPRPDDAAMIEQQYRTIGAPYQFIGSPTFAEVDTLALSKDAATGIYAVIDYMPGVTEVDKQYMADYQKEYNSEADGLAAYNRDAIYLFANAIKKVGEDRTKIRDAILGIHGDWAGVCGTYNFTPNGDGLHANTVVQIDKGGKYKFIKTVQVQPKP